MIHISQYYKYSDIQVQPLTFNTQNIFLCAVRDQKSKDPKDLESKNRNSCNNGVGKGQGVTNDSLQNSDLLTSTIEETECDWEYAHVSQG